MAELPDSFVKFSYLLRPSKQVERKLIAESLQRLRYGGFDLSEYTYVGLGSVYYADFILFHKYLYIDKMICAEASEIPRRMRFNKPYKFVTLRMGPVGDLLPQLSRRRRYFVWLDYDYGLNEDIVQDIAAAINVLAEDSILIVTVDTELRHQLQRDFGDQQRRDRLLEYFTESFDQYVGRRIERRDFADNTFARLVSEVLSGLFRQAVARRPQFSFFPLFNFSYADGAQMLSFGGVIGTDATRRRLQRSRVYDLPFTTKGIDPVRISVPPLTPREKHWLDQNLRQQLDVDDLSFELAADALDNFRRYQRHYPSYHEALL